MKGARFGRRTCLCLSESLLGSRVIALDWDRQCRQDGCDGQETPVRIMTLITWRALMLCILGSRKKTKFINPVSTTNENIVSVSVYMFSMLIECMSVFSESLLAC